MRALDEDQNTSKHQIIYNSFKSDFRNKSQLQYSLYFMFCRLHYFHVFRKKMTESLFPKAVYF